MSTRQALLRSVEITPDVLETTIATQRQQLRDQLHIADGARALEDWELWARSARNTADVAKALHENLEMQMQSRATVAESDTASLWRAIQDRAAAGEKDAQAIIRKAQPKKEPARGRA